MFNTLKKYKVYIYIDCILYTYILYMYDTVYDILNSLCIICILHIIYSVKTKSYIYNNYMIQYVLHKIHILLIGDCLSDYVLVLDVEVNASVMTSLGWRLPHGSSLFWCCSGSWAKKAIVIPFGCGSQSVELCDIIQWSVAYTLFAYTIFISYIYIHLSYICIYTCVFIMYIYIKDFIFIIVAVI